MANKLSLRDVQKRIVTIAIQNESSGFALEVDIELPSISDWNNVLLGIEMPTPPTRQRMVKGAKEDYVDFNDPDFRNKQNIAFERIALRRVTQALLGAGNFPELADVTLDEATDKLTEIADRSIILGVSQALNELMNGTKGGVESKKASFRTDTLPSDSNDNLPEKELVTG